MRYEQWGRFSVPGSGGIVARTPGGATSGPFEAKSEKSTINSDVQTMRFFVSGNDEIPRRGQPCLVLHKIHKFTERNYQNKKFDKKWGPNVNTSKQRCVSS